MSEALCAPPHIERPRLDAALSQACERRITLVCAASGAGKSSAIGAYLRGLVHCSVHYVPDGDASRLVPFVRGLAVECEALPALERSLGAAAAHARETARPATALAQWFVDHLEARRATIAFDDLHAVDGDAEVVEFITHAIECSGPHVRWILGLRSPAAFPLASWLAAETADLHIGDATLAFTPDEAVALGAQLGIGAERTLAANDRVGGHPGLLALALSGALKAAVHDGSSAPGHDRSSGAAGHRHSADAAGHGHSADAAGYGRNADPAGHRRSSDATGRDRSSDSAVRGRGAIAYGQWFKTAVKSATHAFLARLSSEEERALRACLLLPSLDPSLVENIPAGSRTFARLAREAPFGLRRARHWRVTRTFAMLVDRMSAGDAGSADDRGSADNQRSGAGNGGTQLAPADLAIATLEQVQRGASALHVAVRARASKAILTLFERHGFGLVENDGDLAAAVLDALSAADRDSFVASTLEAMRERDLGRYDVADTRFAQAAAAAPNATARAHVDCAYAGHLMRRGRMNCIDVFERLAADAPTSDLKNSAIAALAAAYAGAGRWQEARSHIEDALSHIDESGDAATCASLYQSAAAVALADGDADDAEHFVERALKLGADAGDDRVAASAHSAHYRIASSLRDDVSRGLDALAELEACAKRLRNASFRRSAWLGLIESHAERGDVGELERVHNALSSEELETDRQRANEVLVWARAMRLAWSGDFDGAYSLLGSTVETLSEIERQAARWSEIAVYAAAALRDDTADTAIGLSLRALLRAGGSGGAGPIRTRLNLALAALLLGRVRSATGMLAITEYPAAPFPRLRKYHALLRAMLARRRGASNHEEVLRLLEAMDDVGFGGVARIIEALPDARLTALEHAA